MAEADGDNALLARGGGGLPGPVLVDPLNALTRGNQAAQAEFTTRGMQAQQAIGAILQQSTDENGNIDYQAAHKRAAAAGPVVQMGIMSMAKDASVLRGQQLNNTAGTSALIATQSMSVARDGSAANVNASFDNLRAAGLPAEVVERERARWLAMSEAERQDNAHRIGLQHLDQLRQVIGQTTLQQFGDVARTTTVQQPGARTPGSATVSGQPITVGPPPGSTVAPSVAVDNAGTIPLDANGNFARPTQGPVTYRPSIAPTTSVPGIAPGGQQLGAPGTGGASTPPGAPPVPPPPGTVLKSGAYPPRPAATPAPAPGATPVPPGTTPPAPATPTPAVAGATPPPPSSKPPVFTAPPQQQPEKLKADVEAYTQDQAAVPAIATRSQNMGHAYEALKLLQSATGKGAAGINEIRSRLQTLGLLPEGAVNEQKLVELFTKYTERAMIEAAGGASTDMGRRMSEQSNAGTLLSTPANIDILRNDMGKTLQTFAAYKDAPDQTGNGYLKHRADVADKTDPRGFVWELYTAEEQARINKEVEGNKTASDKLHKAMGMARRLNLQIPGVTGAPPPQRQSFVAPQAPAPNAFAMAQPPGNPLLAA